MLTGSSSSSVFLKKSISGRSILNQRGNGSFVFDARDFEFVDLTHDETEDIQMVWWLVTAYFPHLNQVPRGTRLEMILAMRLLVCHLKECAGVSPSIESTWSYHRKHCIEIAFQRMCDIIDNGAHSGSRQYHPDAHEWDGTAAMRYRYVLVHLTALMQKMTDEAVLLKQNAFLHNQKNGGGIAMMAAAENIIDNTITTDDDDNDANNNNNDANNNNNDNNNDNTAFGNNAYYKKKPKRIIAVAQVAAAAALNAHDSNNNNIANKNTKCTLIMPKLSPKNISRSSSSSSIVATELLLGAFREDTKRWWASSWPTTGQSRWFFKKNTTANIKPNHQTEEEDGQR